MTPAPTFPTAKEERHARTLLATSATGVALGVGLAVLDLPLAGAVTTVGSLLGLIYGVHRFGRSGADGGAVRRRRRRNPPPPSDRRPPAR